MIRKSRFRRKCRQPFNGVRAYQNRSFSPEYRDTLGHWEGDTIRFKKERKVSITTLFDRKIRFLIMCKNKHSTSKIVMENIACRLTKLPLNMLKHSPLIKALNSLIVIL